MTGNSGSATTSVRRDGGDAWKSELNGHWAELLAAAGIELCTDDEGVRAAIIVGDRLTAYEVCEVIERYPTLIVARPGDENGKLYRALGLGELIRVPGAPRHDEPHLRDNHVVAVIDVDRTGQHPLKLHVPQPIAFHGMNSEWRPMCSHGDRVIVGHLEEPGRHVVVVSAEQAFAAPFVAALDNAQALAHIVALLARVTLSGLQQKRVATVLAEVPARYGSTPPVGDMTTVPGQHVVTPSVEALSSVLDSHLSADLNPWTGLEDFLDATRIAYFSMPPELQAAVSTFRSRSNTYGALLVRNLPVADVPDTPADPAARAVKGFESEFWLSMMACALGEPFAYAQEKQGSLFQNILPTRKNADKLSSESSVIVLDYHTEAAFHPFKPDYVLLLCLRQDHDGTALTSNASIRIAMPLLSLQDRWELQQPQFRTGVDHSFGSPNGKQGNGPLLAVLGADPYDPEITYDLDLMIAETDAATRALQALRRAVAKVGAYVALSRGDLLIVDNRQAVHARSEFTPRYDGRDRWLQRMCVTRDLGRSGSWRARGSRVIQTQFNV